MKQIYKILLTFAILPFLGGCVDQFGEKLYGPDRTVAPESNGPQTVMFMNMTEAAQPVSTMPVDVIFSAAQPTGQTKDVVMSARMASGKSKADRNFTVHVVDNPEILKSYEEANGYEVSALPQEAYVLLTDIISLEYGAEEAFSQSILRIVNSESLELETDYLLALELGPQEGFVIDEGNGVLYIHVKRKGGSGEPAGAADFRPMSGDNALDPEGVDLGINRNNLYYTLTGADAMSGMSACTIEGLIYVDSFKEDSERGNGTLAGISSVWGYEASGVPVDFLLRFGDASVSPDRLQLVVSDAKYMIDYTFKEKQWYHIAVTYDGEKLSFYVDGRERFSTARQGTMNLATSGRFNLGQSFNQWRGFNGMMSEVRVWNVARTSKELKDNAIYLVDMTASGSLVAYWKMNAAKTGSGDTMIEDMSGNGYDITVARQGASSTVTPKVVINNDIDINIR